MHRRLLTACTIACHALLLAAVPAQAAAPACPQARVGLSDLGYSSFQEGEHYRGTAVDIIAELHMRTGCTFKLEWFPRGRLFAQFANGRLDIAMSSLRSPERDHAGTWLPYTYTQFELLLTKSQAGKFRSLADFVDHSHARLNVTRGVSYAPAVLAQMDRLEKQGRLEYVNDYGVVFRKIMAGRADGTLAPPVIHALHTRQLHLDDKVTVYAISESPRTMAGMYVSSHTITPAARRLYADALRAMINDGTIQKIYEHYLGADVARRMFSGGMGEILEQFPR